MSRQEHEPAVGQRAGQALGSCGADDLVLLAPDHDRRHGQPVDPVEQPGVHDLDAGRAAGRPLREPRTSAWTSVVRSASGRAPAGRARPAAGAPRPAAAARPAGSPRGRSGAAPAGARTAARPPWPRAPPAPPGPGRRPAAAARRRRRSRRRHRASGRPAGARRSRGRRAPRPAARPPVERERAVRQRPRAAEAGQVDGDYAVARREPLGAVAHERQVPPSPCTSTIGGASGSPPTATCSGPPPLADVASSHP